MSEKSAIVHLVEYPLSKMEVSALPDDQQAALAILSYAVSEANAFAKIYIAASHDLLGDDVIDCATSIQRFVVLRSWSAKLFEIEEFLKLGGKKKICSDEEVLALADASLTDFSKLRGQEGYILARDMRNEATSHYSFSAAKKNLSHVADHANCNMYLHEQNGNSFYPMGEEFMFIGRINRRGAVLETNDERANLINTWMHWNLEANKWLANTHLQFVRSLVIDKNEKKYARKKVYWIPATYVGTKTDSKVPIFYRNEI